MAFWLGLAGSAICFACSYLFEDEADELEKLYEDELTISSETEEDDDETDEEEEEDKEKERKMELIEKLRKENDENTTRFSRTCHYCTTAEPHSRAVFVACGHAVCRDCADEFVIQMDARECPICLAVGEHKPLYEDLDDESSSDNAPLFSRLCRVCYADEPLKRAVFSACGHIVCRACAWQIAIDADDWDGDASYADDAYEALDLDDASDADADDASMTDEDVDGYASVADEEEWDDWSSEDGSVDFSDASDADSSSDSGEESASDADTVSEEDTDDDYDDWNPLSCPLCRTKSGFGPLVEEPIESNP